MNQFTFAVFAVGIVIGMFFGHYTHPYEQCARQHVGDDYVGECVWLKLSGR